MDDENLPPQSLVIETSAGPLGFTICDCGVILLRHTLSWAHINNCGQVARARNLEGTE